MAGGLTIAIGLLSALLVLVYRGAPHQTLLCSVCGICTRVPIEGYTAPGYEGVKGILERAILDGDDLGGRATLYKNGKLVFDVYGGFKDAAHTEPWTKDTISIIFSNSKAVTAIAVAMLVDRGLLELDQPIAKYWPEFAKHGKGKITVSDALRHEDGFVRLDAVLPYATVNDVSKLAAVIENQAFEPTGQRTYHAETYGFIPSVLISKVDPKHRSLSQFVQEEIATPLGVPLYIGLPDSLDTANLAVTNEGNVLRAMVDLLLPHLIFKASGYSLLAPRDRFLHGMLDHMFNQSSVLWGVRIADRAGKLLPPLTEAHRYSEADRRGAQNGATSGFAHAGSLAKLAAAVVNGGEVGGVRLFNNKAAAANLWRDMRPAFDTYITANTSFSAGGLALIGNGDGLTSFPLKGFGWSGWGGSITVLNPVRGAAFSYVMSGMMPGFFHPTAHRIAEFIKRADGW